jgi:hypothetical protein
MKGHYMPQASDIVIADAAGTPVDHTFKPLGKDANGVFWFEDQSQANAVGYWRISIETKRPVVAAPGQMTQNRFYRNKITLHEPILENVSNSTVSGVAPSPMIAYVVRSHVEYVIPERASLQNRKDISKMTPLLLQNSQIKKIVEDLEYLW